MSDKEIVVYERGKPMPIKKREDLELLQIVLLDDMAVSLREMEKSQKEVQKSLEKEEFQGKLDSRTLSATDEVKAIELVKDWPYTPWATATFFNDGPTDPVHIGLNSMNPYATLNTGDRLPADFTKGDRRIEIIYYWCDAGNTASVRAVGKY